MISIDEIQEFIRHFAGCQITFLYGMCYWFAHILHTRFPESSIVYNPVCNHFACQIEANIWDIKGIVTYPPSYLKSHHGYIDWEEYQQIDSIHAERIAKYCIRKED